MALKGAHDNLGGAVEGTRDRDTKPDITQKLLNFQNLVILIAQHGCFSMVKRGRRDPKTNAEGGAPLPGEKLTGIFLAIGSDIGVGDNLMRRYEMAREDRTAQPDRRLNLPVGKRSISKFVSGIGDLNTN